MKITSKKAAATVVLVVAIGFTTITPVAAVNYVEDESSTWVYGRKTVQRSSWCLTKAQRDEYQAGQSDGFASATEDKYLILYAEGRDEEDLVDADLVVRYVKDQRCAKRTKGKRPYTAEYTFKPFVFGEKVPGKSYQIIDVIDYNNDQVGYIKEHRFPKRIYFP